MADASDIIDQGWCMDLGIATHQGVHGRQRGGQILMAHRAIGSLSLSQAVALAVGAQQSIVADNQVTMAAVVFTGLHPARANKEVG